MVWNVDCIVGLAIIGHHDQAKIEFREKIGKCKKYSWENIKNLFTSGLEPEARELYSRTIMYNDGGPTIFLPNEVAELYQVGMKEEAVHFFKRTIRGAKILDMTSIERLFDIGLVREAQYLLRVTAHYAIEVEYKALKKLRKKVNGGGCVRRRGMSRVFRN